MLPRLWNGIGLIKIIGHICTTNDSHISRISMPHVLSNSTLTVDTILVQDKTIRLVQGSLLCMPREHMQHA